MRRVAAELGIDPMTLYRSVPNRDGIVADVVGLLFAEIDASERLGESWDETLLRMHRSERDMALRHPQAYALLVLAPRDEEPALGFAQRLQDVLVRGGLPEDRFFDLWLVDASFTNGFLLLETATLTRASRTEAAAATGAPAGEFGGELAGTVSGEAFVRGLELIYRGFKETFTAAPEP
jgi:AcrR family transcriptional regulator